MKRKTLLVRQPSPRLADGLLTHLDPTPIDFELALKQWHRYVATFEELGWQVVEAPPVPECPDGVFIEDQVVVYSDQALLCRSGAPQRRQEQLGLAELLANLGYTCHDMSAPSTLDGGDVLKHDGHIWVGLTDGGRSNSGGVSALATMVAPWKVSVTPVTVSKALHLKSAVTMLPTGQTLGWEPVVDDPGLWPGFVSMPEEPGAHVVTVDAHTLVMADSAPRSAAMLRSWGYDVVCVDISEFEKLEGCVTCLSVRLRG